MKTVIQQFREALSILKDYPGIERIIAISEAEELLQKMEKILDVPSIIEANENLARHEEEMKERLKNWADKFSNLPLVGCVINLIEDELDWRNNTLMHVPFYSTWNKTEGGGLGDCGLSLYPGNLAIFEVEETEELFGIRTTWEDAYKKLSEYIQKKTEVPGCKL